MLRCYEVMRLWGYGVLRGYVVTLLCSCVVMWLCGYAVLWLRSLNAHLDSEYAASVASAASAACLCSYVAVMCVGYGVMKL